MPSFELWLLLHYEDIQAPLHRDEVMRRLKLHIPGYEKGAGKAFATTSEHLAAATQRAERLAARFTADTDPEPFYRHCGTGGAADHASQLTWQSGAPRTHVAILCCPPIKMRLRSFSLQRSCHFD